MTHTQPERIQLARIPTPIHQLSRISEALSIDLWIKRDDLTGSALSGNKIRKLEYLLAEARQGGADTILTCGGAQSNHARATAVAAAQLGMKSVLFLRGAEYGHLSGNLHLDKLVGAEIRPITREQYGIRDQLMHRAAEELSSGGARPYIIPEGGSNALGSMGYVQCVAEIAADPACLESGFDLIVTAVGSGGTLAGLGAGHALHELGGRVLGFAVCDDEDYFAQRVGGIMEDMGRRFGLPVGGLTDAVQINDRYVGRGYGLSRPEELTNLRWIARSEGILLDPVYTGKAFHGLAEEVRLGHIPQGSRVLFLHTGGIFGLFRGDEAEQVGG